MPNMEKTALYVTGQIAFMDDTGEAVQYLENRLYNLFREYGGSVMIDSLQIEDITDDIMRERWGRLPEDCRVMAFSVEGRSKQSRRRFEPSALSPVSSNVIRQIQEMIESDLCGYLDYCPPAIVPSRIDIYEMQPPYTVHPIEVGACKGPQVRRL